MFPPQRRDVVGFLTPPPNERHEAIRRDLSERLRKLCNNLSDEEFAALVEKMLQVQLNGERRFS